MSSKATPKVVVLMGGPSAEHDVSMCSGSECAAALRDYGYNVIELIIARDGDDTIMQRLREAQPDVVFNALHGRFGEDGCIQGILEWLALPYTHSGIFASSLAMDKQRSKDVFSQHGLPVSFGVLADKHDVQAEHIMPPPYVIKPNDDGSSVGIYLVTEQDTRPPVLADDIPQTVLVEQFVPGRELTVAVVDDKALSVTDIITDAWYDYDAKYSDGGSTHIVPAQIPQDIYDACMDYATRAHRALGCKGASRTDFRWNEQKGLDGLVLLETNTQPGMTPTSLLPEQAAHCGMSFQQLCVWLVEDALCEH